MKQCERLYTITSGNPNTNPEKEAGGYLSLQIRKWIFRLSKLFLVTWQISRTGIRTRRVCQILEHTLLTADYLSDAPSPPQQTHGLHRGKGHTIVPLVPGTQGSCQMCAEQVKETVSEDCNGCLRLSTYNLGFPDAQLGKNPPAMQETPAQPLGQEDPLEKGKATHSSILGLPL